MALSSSYPFSRILMLLDHENVPLREFPVSRLIQEVAQARVAAGNAPPVLQIHVRAYGGWFEGNSASAARARAFEYYQNNLPAITRVGHHLARCSFEFADYPLSITDSRKDDRRLPITHTVATRNSPVHFKKKAATELCPEVECQLSAVTRWLNKRTACTKRGCTRSFGETFERNEQKQVDIHLAVDLLTAARDHGNCQSICIVTSDWDFLPALQIASSDLASSSTISVVRFGKSGTHLDSTLESLGILTITL